MTTGVFLYYPNAAYLQETTAALRKLVDVREIKADSEMVSNLVPRTLQRGVKSWLILCHPNHDQVLLILPFPDENHMEFLSNTVEGFPDPIIMELSRLIEMFVYRSSYFFFRENRYSEWFRRFQYLHSDVNLSSILDTHSTQQQQRRNVVLCQETSQNIQRGRENALRRTQREGNFSVLAGQLENVFLRETDNLFINIRNQGFREVVPPIVDEFSDVMDGETMRFLITSETVRKFAGNSSFSDFDYSAPGCGLWKTMERELNLSLVLHLRREAGIVESISIPWKGNGSGKFHILTAENQSIDLNRRESKSPKNLEGITLGPMKHMLELGYCNTVRERLENLFCPDASMLQFLLGQDTGNISLPSCLDKIIRLRNGHAHIHAMSKQKFGELRNLILPSGKSARTCLVEILEFKRKVLEYWETKGDCFTTNQMFVTTENQAPIDFSCYNRMNVRYEKNKSTVELVATCGDGNHSCIATFNKIEEANAALAALAKAVDDGEQCWSALEFKKNLGGAKGTKSTRRKDRK